MPGSQIKHLLLLAAMAYGILVLVVFIMQPGLLYLADVGGREITATPADINLAYEEVHLVTADNVQLHGWYVPHPESRATVLFFHGNAGNISHRLHSISIFHQLRFSVFILDYRGYGQSEGHPTEQGTRQDANAGWQYLTQQRKLPAQQLILFGRSLGAAVAAELATRHRPAALIVESAFTSVPDIAADVYPWLPARWISRYSYNTREYLQQVTCPVLVVHSEQDDIIPFKHGQALFQVVGGVKDMLLLRGGHNEGFWLSRETYMRGLERFIADNVIHPDRAK
jgi:fermentation-respiration switch protein FrsA (DUF1100 family)